MNGSVNPHDIAIIGISAKLPRSGNLQDFWVVLRDGVDCIGEMPPNERKEDLVKYMDLIGLDPESIQIPEGAYLDRIDEFDYKFFNISPNEANLMDPCQRIFLEVAWSAIEDAGYGGNQINTTKTGVYVGISGDSEYKKIIAQIEPDSLPGAVTGNIRPIIASRISHLLDLRGPSMIVDTSCSSSLVAVHLACQAINSGDCDMAIVGGVRISVLPYSKENIADIGIVSSTGRTRAFDDNSDGTGGGEGVIAMVIKPMASAINDGDHIYAVIKGSAINNDGKSIGITAPNPQAQEEVIMAAWEKAKISPKEISYIEAHGTGTYLGDLVEVEGITRAFRRYTSQKQYCALGALKTNIGHLDGAAGIAGLLKAVLSLKHGELPANLHFNTPNSNIDFVNSPVYVNNKHAIWETGGNTRICGVSSFGLSGTNCHVILEESPTLLPNKIDSNQLQRQVLTISARSESALLSLIASYKSRVAKLTKDEIDHLCFTANIGRNHYNRRLALLVNSMDDLMVKLIYLLEFGIDHAPEKGIFFGKFNMVSEKQVPIANGDITKKQIADYTAEAAQLLNTSMKDLLYDSETLVKLCSLYVLGADINLGRMYERGNYRRISIPTYQFDRTRCWVKTISQHTPKTRDRNKTSEPTESNNQKVATLSLQDNRIELAGKQDHAYTELEIEIARLWAEILGFTQINVFDDFFDMGGDSISGMKLINSINRKFKLDLETELIFEKSTIYELSLYIQQLSDISSVDSLYQSLMQLEPAEHYPLSSAQKRLFILHHVQGIKGAYNETSMFLVKGKLDIEKLAGSIQTLVNRHEIIRTYFVLEKGVPVQKVKISCDFKLYYLEIEADQFDISTCIGQYDLKLPPLFKVSVVRIAPEEHYLVFDIHHIISDGTSLNILVKELMSLYNGVGLSPLPLQYRDYVSWEEKLLQTEAMKRQESYWLRLYDGEVPILELPTDYKRPDIQSFDGEMVGVQVDSELLAKLHAFSRKHNITLFMLLFACYTILLSKYSGQRDIIVGTNTSGRGHPDLEGVVGILVNTIALRSKPDGHKTIKSYLQEVKDHILQAFSNQQYPFDLLISKLHLPMDRSRNPLFQTMFLMQNFERTDLELEGVSVSPLHFDRAYCKFDTMMEASENTEGLQLRLYYCRKLFSHESMEIFIYDYQILVKNIILNEMGTLSDL